MNVKFNWQNQPKNILLIKKWKDEECLGWFLKVAKFLKQLKITVYVNPDTYDELENENDDFITYTEENMKDLHKIIDL
jgi:hypothetical protein